MVHNWPNKQHGSTLLVGVMVLLVVMALGLSGASHSWLESRMTSNYVKNQDLFYYANAALNDGKRRLKDMDPAAMDKVKPRLTIDEEAGGAQAESGAQIYKKNPDADNVSECPADGGDDKNQYCLVALDLTPNQDFSAGSRTYKLVTDSGDAHPIRVRWYAIHLLDKTRTGAENLGSSNYSGKASQRYFEINARADRGDNTPGVSLRGVVALSQSDNKQ